MKQMTKHLGIIITILFSTQCFAVNGIAVTNKATSMNNWGTMGPLLRSYIKNSDVDRQEEIYSDKAHHPTLNHQGTHIAFFRDDGTDVIISLIGVDGGEITDVVKHPKGNGFNAWGQMSWPVGDWIYYNGGADATGTCSSAESVNIRKVNINNPNNPILAATVRTPVSKTPKSPEQNGRIRSFDLDAFAGRASFQFNLCGGSGIFNASFPDELPAISSTGNEVGTCNTAISASGKYWIGITGTGHNAFHLGKTGAEKYHVTVSCNDMSVWSGGNAGNGLDRNRFSVNSDKWVCTRPNHTGRFVKDGCEQVLVNWVDQEAIIVTDNRTGGTFYSEAGSFWIEGGEYGKVESIGGTWISASEASPIRPATSPAFKSNVEQQSGMYSLRGKKILKNTESGIIIRNGKIHLNGLIARR